MKVKNGWLAAVWIGCCLVAIDAHAQDHGASAPDARRNWYGDPFIALSKDFPGCPEPLGPRITHAKMIEEAHYRAEQGTSCWLAHECSKPNSFLYDKPIAQAAQARFAHDGMLAGTSIWITVQRRFIYADGCAAPGFDRDALRRALAALPDVQQVFVRVTADPHREMPYTPLGSPE